MANRKYINCSIAELESIFKDNQTDSSVLHDLAAELENRHTLRAIGLAERVDNLLDGLSEPHLQSDTESKNSGTEDDASEMDEYPDYPQITPLVPHDWDPTQKKVIHLDEDYSAIIEAGPGSGKTAVACARVANLIEEHDLAPSNILLISFTRTAVKELRDRIEFFAEEAVNVAGLRIATLDSFTWQLVRGFTENDTSSLLQSYEGNIQQFVDLLDEEDEDLLDFLDELEHVVIDEAQDLVGVRADLTIKLITRLPDHCGVTVFADSAQAIYGFTNDEGASSQSLKTAVERIYDGEAGMFSPVELDRVHRTEDENLLRLYSIGRERLRNLQEDTADGWKQLKSDIIENAHKEIGKIEEEPTIGRADDLVLFRTRAEALMASSMLWSSGVPNKLRMSGIPARIHPWIGRVLWDYTDRHLSRIDFEGLWDRNVGESESCSWNVDDAWELLEDNAASRQRRVDVARLREILSRDRPPVDFLVDEKELAGPLVGTIHASKGRESNHVYLMLPPDRYIHDDMEPRQIAEEERVLFVGASRARIKLNVGKGMRLFGKRLDSSGRTFRHCKRNNCMQMEFGHKDDIDIVSLASNELLEIDEANGLQAWLWEKAISDVSMVSWYDYDRQVNALYTESQDYVCDLSNRVSHDLWTLAKLAAARSDSDPLKPNQKILHIRMIGVTTVVVPEAARDQLHSPWRESGFVLAPVISGFPSVYFNRRGG